MIEAGRGLIVEITDGDFLGYRGNRFYDLVTVGVSRLAGYTSWGLPAPTSAPGPERNTG